MKTQKPTPTPISPLSAFGLFFLTIASLLASGIVFAKAANFTISGMWIALSASFLLFILITRGRTAAGLFPSVITFAAVLAVMTAVAVEAPGSLSWEMAMGGLVVAVWMTGLLYILLASALRIFGNRHILKFFPKEVLYPVWTVAGIAPLWTLIDRSFNVGGAPDWLNILLASGAFIVSLWPCLFRKTRPFALWIGPFSGLIAGILYLVIAAAASGTLSTLGSGLWASATPLLIYQDPESYFGFWAYLHFDGTSLAMLLPTAWAAFGLHAWQQEASVHPSRGLDRYLATEGIATMTSGFLSAMPIAVIPFPGGVKKKPLWPLLLATLLIGLCGFFPPVGALFGEIPTAVILGVMSAVLLLTVLRTLITLRPLTQPTRRSFRGIVLFVLPVLAGLATSVFGRIAMVTGWGYGWLYPWNIGLGAVAVATVLGWLLHWAWPVAKKVSDR